MRLAVIGAGPAGLTCVKQALADGHDVVCYEKHQDLGGIWNPASGGAYAGVRMQSSRMSMPFSDHPPDFTADFPTQAEVQGYLHAYAAEFGLLDVVRFGREVVSVVKEGGRWRVDTRASGGPIWAGGGDGVGGGSGGSGGAGDGAGASPAGRPLASGEANEGGGPGRGSGARGFPGGPVPASGEVAGDGLIGGGSGGSGGSPGTPAGSGGIPGTPDGPRGLPRTPAGSGGIPGTPAGSDGLPRTPDGSGSPADSGPRSPVGSSSSGVSPGFGNAVNSRASSGSSGNAGIGDPQGARQIPEPAPVANPEHSELFDAVLVANGELWRPRLPDSGLPAPGSGVRVLTSPEYRGPETFAGKRVLVVGGGVSGADIAADLAPYAARVDWSVRRRQLFLPRDIGGDYNDALFSYAGRVAVEEVPYDRYLSWLTEWMPEYMGQYRATGLLPGDGYHGAVHVNEKIVPAVYDGGVTPVAAFRRFTEDGGVVLADDTLQRYDAVVLCLGYEAPDYGFLPGLRREDLYEHHFWRHDPTLAVVNTPVDTEAFGTACPYFEAIGGWVLSVLGGKTALPGPEERAAWCADHMNALADRRYLDCWLETIRLGLLSGALPDPAVRFRDYWTLISSQVDPANLRPGTPSSLPAAHDDRFDLDAVRHRILASLPVATRQRLLAEGEIEAGDVEAAARVPEGRALEPWLPYRQRESEDAGAGEGRGVGGPAGSRPARAGGEAPTAKTTGIRDADTPHHPVGETPTTANSLTPQGETPPAANSRTPHGETPTAPNSRTPQGPTPTDDTPAGSPA
ncbi:NAD(P)-binding protein [Streptomyces niveiscabiei]|uniref:NAD(P)-binding protein n=1 Tax=Streptomyces niveiscabiei TaxID=164115 RepID=A0ABW9HU68_9ACTN